MAAELKRAAHIVNHVTAAKAAGRTGDAFQTVALTGPTSKLTRRSNTVLARRWAMARARLAVEADWLSSCERGACRDPRAATWLKTVSLIRSVPRLERPALVQKLFSHRIRYERDPSFDDHWATPLATLLRGAGDCEDHVLLKRAVLMAAGYGDTDTRLLILQTASGTGHMALEVDGPQTLVLDNRYRYPTNTRSMTGDRVAAIATGQGYFTLN